MLSAFLCYQASFAPGIVPLNTLQNKGQVKVFTWFSATLPVLNIQFIINILAKS